MRPVRGERQTQKVYIYISRGQVQNLTSIGAKERSRGEREREREREKEKQRDRERERVKQKD